MGIVILDRIIETKAEEVAALKETTTPSRLRDIIAGLPRCLDFQAALAGLPCAIIAEVKCASPSRGRLVENFDPLSIAKIYEQAGAAAISVLTDEKYFCGQKSYVTQIRSEIRIPILRKDFIIDPLQVYETRAIGADAVLLIVRVLGKKLPRFIALAQELGLAPLVEVHSQAELELALAAGADMIGINNRNLDTFVTDIATSRHLKKMIPAGKTVIAESAIKDRADVEYLLSSGIHAFLIGEGLVTAKDIGQQLQSLRGDHRK